MGNLFDWNWIKAPFTDTNSSDELKAAKIVIDYYKHRVDSMSESLHNVTDLYRDRVDVIQDKEAIIKELKLTIKAHKGYIEYLKGCRNADKILFILGGIVFGILITLIGVSYV